MNSLKTGAVCYSSSLCVTPLENNRDSIYVSLICVTLRQLNLALNGTVTKNMCLGNDRHFS